MKKSIKTATTILSALAVMGATAQAATVTWDGGGGDGLWVTPTNWDTNAAPAAGDTIIINTAVTVDGLGLTPFGNLPSGATINLTGGAVLTMSGGAIRMNDSNITVGSGSSLTGAFWDLDDVDITFANGSAATMSDWEQKDVNSFTFQMGSSGFTTLTPGAFRIGGAAPSITNATYNVDMAGYTGGTGIITLMDFTTDTASMNNTLFQTAGGLNVLNAGGYTANLQWNDTTEAIELNVTAVPEPSSLVLLGIATLAIASRRRRFQQSKN